MPLRAGDLRAPITFQTKATTPGTLATTDEAYSFLADDWARVETISGTRRLEATNAGAGATHIFEVRYRDDIAIDSSVFILYSGRRFSIQDQENVDERDESLRLLCEELRDAA